MGVYKIINKTSLLTIFRICVCIKVSWSIKCLSFDPLKNCKSGWGITVYFKGDIISLGGLYHTLFICIGMLYFV